MSADNQDVPYRNSTDTPPAPRRGRPRSVAANRAILYAAREELVEHGFTRFRLEHVAARAGVGKSTLYRRWPSKEALAQELLAELAAPHIAVDDIGDTGAELRLCVAHALRAVRDTPFGQVIRTLLSQGMISAHPMFGASPEFDYMPDRPRRKGFFARWREGRARKAAARDEERDRVSRVRVDEVLDKVSREGIGSLTPEERRILDEASRRGRGES